jgi:8-oxo-dGTP diphosphatase/2-hydroxy-dATP diphosphatase
MKVLTLAVIHDDEKILLGLKKRGFGMGRWNGFGGKLKEGETIMEAAHRELEEEAGITTDELTERGQIYFSFEDGTEDLEIHIFSSNTYNGEIMESDEMKPQWFAHSEIPYDEMWAEDPYWLPLVLAGKNISGKVHYDKPSTQVILRNTIQET